MRIPIVNEQDEVVGEEERSLVHTQGLRHREVHVWIVTEEKKIVFQKRGLNKDTWPGCLDATAGGHVDFQAETYEKAAKRELKEETGINKAQLFFVGKIYKETYDPNTKTQNNKFLSIFCVKLSSPLGTLIAEKDKGLGFEAFSIDELENLSDVDKKKFIPGLIREDWINIYKKMIDILFV